MNKNLGRMNLPFIVYVSICLVGAANFVLFGESDTIIASLHTAINGVFPQGILVMRYLFYMIVHLGLVYLFLHYFERIQYGQMFYILIRSKSFLHWFLHQLGNITLLGLVWLVALALLFYVGGLLRGLPLGAGVEDVPTTIILYHHFINGLLQFVNYALIAFIVFWIWRSDVLLLGSFAVMFLLGLPAINTHQFLPFALSSMGYVTSAWFGVFTISGVLVAFIIIEIVFLILVFKKAKSI
ncbi:hypothetical protein [Aureibacillus halotolerans]|uniref:Uncharacterized protein n=1 Tax=Aureibacillus halotolerans TaxID=1508390 RepID=A0A4R6TYG5_9BACI|nr:hypothetical protein [Aureibacillus halotolerans]TDQ38366.1 hypothetical protein EV213_110113 [Aureibacillus halotolerans]